MSDESEIFTPGPWHVSPGEPGASHTIVAGDDHLAFILPLGPRLEVMGNARLMAQAPQMRDSLLKALAYLTPEQAEDCEIAAALGRVEPAPPKPTRVVVIGGTPYVVSTIKKGQELMIQHNFTSGWVHECVVDAGFKKYERDH